MNKDKKKIQNDNLQQSLTEVFVDQLEPSQQCINKEIIELEKKILLEQDNLLNKKKYIAEEIEKVKKRIKKDMENTYKFALEKFINELLQIIDNLERGLALALADQSNTNFKEVINKLELTLKLCLDTLKIFGLKKINEVSVPFNPDIHQAMSIQFSESIKENYVISILQNGYLLNNRLLRPAMVIVSKRKQ
ncbi:nucleotide exchange factor GrpE [Buchnera aphidicola]|uniref:nucleotide exchange factor GrpE n=1 Tax=Buchnera aphidicola TaxID=9 RepID=UPI003464A7BE